jgi:hypothetical protein
MDALKRSIKAIERRNKQRIKRAMVIHEAVSPVGWTDAAADRLIDAQLNEIRSWPVEKIIDEFIDREELLIRAASKMI